MGKNIMKLDKLATAIALIPFTVSAQMVPEIDRTAAVAPGAAVISNPPIQLNDKDRRALQLVREWTKNPDKPRREEDGGVRYLFGATLPTLICTPLQVCAIRLQAGEKVNGIPFIGDKTRWHVVPGEVGSGPNKTVHAIVKPTEAGLKTNLIIMTDRRKYIIQLKSAKHEWMPYLSFDYPDDTERAWSEYREKQDRSVYGSTLATGESVGELDFGFRLGGDNPKWKPQRVYRHGSKTIIEFPAAAFGGDLPVLVVLGKDGSMFSGPTEEVVNYRLIGKRFVVDGLPEKAALITDVGRNQTRVTIDYVGDEK